MTNQEIKAMLCGNIVANQAIIDVINSLETEIKRLKEVVRDQDSVIERQSDNYNRLYHELRKLKASIVTVPIWHTNIDRVHDEIMPMPPPKHSFPEYSEPVHSDQIVERIPPSKCNSCEKAYPEQVEVDDE